MHGVAVGFAQSTLTAYVSEIAPTPIRGALLGVYSICMLSLIDMLAQADEQ